MASIVIIYPDLNIIGGSQVVLMNILEALQDSHELSLLTIGDVKIEKLNDIYNTNVYDIERVPNNFYESAMKSLGSDRFYILKKALLANHLDKSHEKYDLAISAMNEIGISLPSIQYIHYPDRGMSPDRKLANGHELVYDLILDKFQKEVSLERTAFITNSNWTADIIESIYDIVPRVVYPPVSESEFSKKPWEKKESGFITIGRIESDKNTHKILDIIKKVRNAGINTHIHLIGGFDDSDYSRSVLQRAEDHEWIKVEGFVSREKMVELVEKHRYGIHGKKDEHFGIAVAEMIAGGIIPFVPNGGGQVEIINSNKQLLYTQTNEASQKIQTVVSSPQLQAKIRSNLPAIKSQFGRQRFQNQINEVVDNIIREL